MSLDNNFPPSGKGLFVFSDPGGAKPLLAFIKMYAVECYVVVSDRKYDFFDDFNLDVRTYGEKDEEILIKKIRPDYVFTGTSYTSKLELKFIKSAQANNIISYSFIDHYTSYVERFEFESKLCFPDFICLIDERARKIAIEKSLKASLIITGNFYQHFLRNWTPNFTRTNFLQKLKIPKESKIIVYAPDPLSNVGGIDKYGLDEHSVLRDTLMALESLNRTDLTLLIKAHPNQNKQNLFKDDVQSDKIRIIMLDSVHTNTLLYYADLVIGMFSNILVEASILGTEIIRCLIGFKQPDPLSGFKTECIIRDKDDFISKLKRTI